MGDPKHGRAAYRLDIQFAAPILRVFAIRDHVQNPRYITPGQLRRFHEAVDARMGLKALFKHVGLPWQLRKYRGGGNFMYISLAAFDRGCESKSGFLYGVTDLSLPAVNETLWASIFDVKISGKRHRDVTLWLWRHWRGDFGFSDFMDFAQDYLGTHENKWPHKWSLEQAMAASDRWHEAQADMELSRLDNHTHVLPPAPMPVRGEYEGLEFIALTSERMLGEDGKKMRHCVVGYWHAVWSRQIVIYSVRDIVSGKWLATWEIKLLDLHQWEDHTDNKVRAKCKAAKSVQLKAKCNGRPHQAARIRCGEWLAGLFAAKKLARKNELQE